MDISALQLTLRRFAAELMQVADEASISLHSGPGPKTHVLVDWENVQPNEAECRALVPEATDVWLFHGPSQKNVGRGYATFGERVTPVRIARTGKNALDFHLSFYMGYLAAKDPGSRLVVLSNDKGYGPMLDHAKELGFVASQSGFGAVALARPARRSTARKTAGKQTQATKKATPAPAARKAAAKKAPQSRKQAARKSTATTRPATTSPATPTATAPGTPAARKSAAKTSSVAKTSPAAKSASASRTSPAKAAPGPRSAPVPTAAPTATSAPAAKKSFEQVLAILKKSPAASRPRKHARLLAYVASRVGLDSEADARAMLDRLVAEGKVAVDDKWNVSYRL